MAERALNVNGVAMEYLTRDGEPNGLSFSASFSYRRSGWVRLGPARGVRGKRKMTMAVASPVASLGTASDSRLQHRRVRALWVIVGPLLIVGANHVLRHKLEAAPLPAYPIF